MQQRAGRSRLLATSEGRHPGAFRPFDWLLLVTTVLVWGGSFFFIAVGLDHFEPGVVTFGRVAFGAGALWVLPAARKVRIEPRDRGRVALLGICWMAIPLTMFPLAEQWIDSSVAGMLNASVPIWTVLLAIVLLRRLPRQTVAVGLLIGLVGVIVLSWPSLHGADASAPGVILSILATMSYGFATNLAVPLQQRYGAIPVLARAQLVALPLVVPYAVVGVPSSSFALGSFGAVLALGALGTGLAFVTATTLMGRVGAMRGSVFTYLMPAVAIALGLAFRNEALAATSAAGVLIVLAGAFLVTRAEQAPPAVIGD
jgi:drug/metabolite transporter (DMT)-like permease